MIPRWKKRELTQLGKRLKLQEALTDRETGVKLAEKKRARRKQQGASRRANRA